MSGMTISEAKQKVTKIFPFLGALLYALPVVEDSSMPTLGVDGETLFYNPEFWNKHQQKEQYGLLMHEAGHLFFQHLFRGRNYKEIAVDPVSGQMISLFNIAGDYVINNMIDVDNRISLPKGCLVDHKYDNMTTEEVYEDLCKNMKKMSQKDMEDFVKKHGGFCDKSKWNKHGGKKAKELEQRWQERIKQGVEYARQQGNEPAWLKRMYEDMQPKEDWRILLREYVQNYAGDYTFSPVDRRFMDADFLLPDIQDGQKVDWLAVAIDTSGSIQEKELLAFLGEVRGILGAYDKVKVRLTFCDAVASKFVEMEEYEKDKVQVSGGGGTDFRPVFDLIKKEDMEPKALLYFTDTQGEFPKHAPDYDVLWIAIEKGQVPWGKKLDYKV